ncbi:MAG: major Facilitator Superfamily protein, partial [Burkholderiaceae bacterium]|nr:major Facilitator Superfamily protein [Burkholderiaceae bacterium]
MPDLQRDWQLPAAAVGSLTSAVQFGFISGTLAFAALTIADRFSPRQVFLLCALAGAACNAAGALLDRQYAALLALRFATGFFLAGIYPVGMKIA